jgi:tetratricopeptide (TPR) repeat protein
MPGVEDFWVGWYNDELASESTRRVVFPVPEDGDEWLTPEDGLNTFIALNMSIGKEIYLTSYGLWDVNIDLGEIEFPIRPYKSLFKVLAPDEMQSESEMIVDSLDFWKSVFREQGPKLAGFTSLPFRDPREEFIFYRYIANLYNHARWAEEKDMPKEAVEFCRMALEIDPFRIETHDLIARQLFKLGDAAQAEIYIVELLRMYPENPNFHFTAATFYKQQGNSEKAYAECIETLKLDPGHPRANELKGWFEEQMN